MSCVAPGLFIGGKRTSSDLPWLQSHGITLVVNVTDDLPNIHPEHMSYIRIPLQDLPTASLNTAIADSGVLPSIALTIAAKNAVLVHCRAGSSRSASVILAYLVSQGSTLLNAYKMVSEIHPIKPNGGFAGMLVEYEVQTRGEATVVIDGFSNWKPVS